MGRELMYSKVDKFHKQKGLKSLSDFKRLKLSKQLLKKYARDSTLLEEDDDINKGNGFIYLDMNDELMGYVYTQRFRDGLNWICGIEVTKRYKGYGLASQILKDAVEDLGAEALGVDNTNKLAIKVYKDFGFVEGKSELFSDEAKRLCTAMYTYSGLLKLKKEDTKMNDIVIESFITYCGEMMIPAEEGFNKTFYKKMRKIQTSLPALQKEYMRQKKLCEKMYKEANASGDYEKFRTMLEKNIRVIQRKINGVEIQGKSHNQILKKQLDMYQSYLSKIK